MLSSSIIGNGGVAPARLCKEADQHLAPLRRGFFLREQTRRLSRIVGGHALELLKIKLAILQQRDVNLQGQRRSSSLHE